MMKFLAILRDSIRETIDSKVFFVVAAISLLAIAVMVTLRLEPNSVEDGLRKITDRFADGSQEVTLPIMGTIKATPSLTRYTVQDLQGPEDNTQPWDAQYQFVIEARDLVPLGTRMAMVRHTFLAEEEKEQLAPTGQKTRARQFQEELAEEINRVRDRELKKGTDPMETNRRMLEQMVIFLVGKLEKEVQSVTPAQLENFIRGQLESHGNWNVSEVRWIDLPPGERNLKISTKVAVPEGDDVRITNQEKQGEVNKFLVKVTSKKGTFLAWPHQASLFFGGLPLGSSQLPGELVAQVTHYVVGWFGAPIIMLLGCIITSFFIPNMLRKGTIDLLLAKPVSRPGLLLYKYVGGLSFMFLNTLVLVLGLWLALGFRSGLWEFSILLIIPVLTLECALFYALSAFLAVLTRSPIVCILGCILLWFLLFALGWGNWLAEVSSQSQPDTPPGWLPNTVKAAHTVLPHYLDLDWLVDRTVMERLLPEGSLSQVTLKYGMYNWPESLLVTSLYIVFLLGLACWRFSARDY